MSEGATWLVAFSAIRKSAKESHMPVKDYSRCFSVFFYCFSYCFSYCLSIDFLVMRSQDPSVNVVLMEDLAAVIGVIVAGSCMGLSSIFQSNIPDAVGSLLVGGILGTVASFIIYTNVAALVGR